MASTELRWGIAGTGAICSDFVNALKANLQGHEVTAVAARSLGSAQKFAQTFDIPHAFEGYEALALSEVVDVVYVGTIHPAHAHVVKTMLKAKKAVLCEKPLGINVKETKEMIQCARDNDTFLMEAIWSRFLPSYDKLSDLVRSGRIGDVRYVHSTFGEAASHVDRLVRKDLGGGTMLDLGLYNVNLISFVFGPNRLPDDIHASGHLFAKEETDESITGTFIYRQGAQTGSFTTHGSCKLPNTGDVVGTKGRIMLECPFWAATQLRVFGNDGKLIETYDFPIETEPVTAYNFVNSSNLHFEAKHVAECLKAGLKQSPKLPWEETIAIAQMMESCRKQVGVSYPQDL